MVNIENVIYEIQFTMEIKADLEMWVRYMQTNLPITDKNQIYFLWRINWLQQIFARWVTIEKLCYVNSPGHTTMLYGNAAVLRELLSDLYPGL